MRAGIVTALAFAVVVVLVATAGAAVRPVGVTHSQAAILDHGLKVKLHNDGRKSRRVEAKLKSNTFDAPAWAKLAQVQARADAAALVQEGEAQARRGGARASSRRAPPGTSGSGWPATAGSAT